MATTRTRRFLLTTAYAAIAGLAAFLLVCWPRLVFAGIGRVVSGAW